MRFDGEAVDGLLTHERTRRGMARSFQLPRYDCGQTQRELDGSGIECPPVDAQLLGTYLRYLRRIGFIQSPDELSRRPEPSEAQRAR